MGTVFHAYIQVDTCSKYLNISVLSACRLNTNTQSPARPSVLMLTVAEFEIKCILLSSEKCVEPYENKWFKQLA